MKILRGSWQHILAIREIDGQFNRMIQETRERFLSYNKRPGYDPDEDITFVNAVIRINDDRSEAFDGLRARLVDSEEQLAPRTTSATLPPCRDSSATNAEPVVLEP